MKKIIGLTFVSLYIVVLTGCGNNRNESNVNNQKPTSDRIKSQKKDRYSCEMDTDVHSDRPGICPKCGMELVKDTN